MQHVSHAQVADSTLAIINVEKFSTLQLGDINITTWKQRFFYYTSTKGCLICRSNNKPHASYGQQIVRQLIEDLNDNYVLPKSINIERLNEEEIIEKIIQARR